LRVGNLAYLPATIPATILATITPQKEHRELIFIITREMWARANFRIQPGCFRKKASMSMAKQKAPNARRAIVEQ
jgi:hypothetical protein